MLPLIYASRLDIVPDDARAPFAAWYTRRHAPDLIGAGFLSVSSFRAEIGSPWVCSLYELRDVDAFGPAYLRAREADDDDKPWETTSSSLAVYEQVATAGLPVGDVPGGQPRWGTSLLAPVIGTFRFSAGKADDAVLQWYEAEELPRLASQPDCISARLGRQVDAGRPNLEPRAWSVFVEWTTLTAASDWAGSGLEEAHGRGVGSAAGDASVHVLRRISSLHHPDAWST